MKKGFTLLEILVAIAILSFIAIIMVRGLQIVMVSKDRIEVASSDLESLQISLTIINQDLQQMVNRPITDNAGQIEGAAVLISQPLSFSFTRGGYANPDNAARRSTLQRVSYRFVDNKLERVTWPVLDRVSTTPSYSRILFSDLSGVTWKFLANDQQFHTSWPAGQRPLPSAVELTLTLSNGKTLTKLFALPSISSTSTPQSNPTK